MGDTVHYIAGHGTWDLGEDAWWRHGSAFCKLAGSHGLHCEEEFEEFYWSGGIDGVSWKTFLTLGLAHDKHYTWMASGLSFKNRLRLSRPENRNVIAHSHMLQVLAYADIPVNNIITVGSPIRNEMADLYLRLRKRCNKWMHIYDERWDKMGFLGQFGDGRWFGGRDCPMAHHNVPLRKIGHSDILRHPDKMQYWVKHRWFDFLKTGVYHGRAEDDPRAGAGATTRGPAGSQGHDRRRREER